MLTKVWLAALTSAQVAFGIFALNAYAEPFLYWTDTQTDKIHRSNIDGSNAVDLIDAGSFPEGLAIDVSNSLIYFTDAIDGTVARAR